MSKSKKNSVLHFVGGKGFTPQRHKFLDGTWTTYFGPGHKPDIIGNTYYPVTDWMKVKTLMRPPQVVWLEVRIEWSQSQPQYDYEDVGLPTNDGTAAAAWSGPTYSPTFDGILGNAYVWEDEEFLGHFDYVVQPNAALIEKQRLVSVFSAVKTAIEALRPGRTWVQVVNWFDDYDYQLQLGDHSGEIEKHLITDDFSSPWWTTEAGFVEAPDAVFPRLDWFGTDFMGVYCGTHYMYNQLMTGTAPTGDPATDLAASSEWTNIYGRLVANKDKFFGYAARLYHPDVSWGSWAYGGTGSPIDDVAPFPTPYHWFSAGIDDASSTGLDTYTAGVYDAAASIAATDHMDITHPGDTSLVTEDYLKNLIAAHFHFNPTTGKDL